MHAHRCTGTHVGLADSSARARWIGRLREQDLTLACGAAVLINLLLVAAIPHVSGLAQPGGGLLPALMRELATLVIAAPLMILGRRWKAVSCVGAR